MIYFRVSNDKLHIILGILFPFFKRQLQPNAETRSKRARRGGQFVTFRKNESQLSKVESNMRFVETLSYSVLSDATSYAGFHVPRARPP